MKDTMSPTLKQKAEKIKELARKKHILLRTQKLMEKRNPSLKTSPQEKPPMNLLEEAQEQEKQALINLVDLIDEYVPRSKCRKGEPSNEASSDPDEKP